MLGAWKAARAHLRGIAGDRLLNAGAEIAETLDEFRHPRRETQHFLEHLNKQEGQSKSFSPGAIAGLCAHSWPGNVRELKNYAQRAYILADEVIEADLAPATVTAPDSESLLSVRVGSTLEEVSRRLIEATLAECGSKRKAADMLGISLKTLYNRLAVYKSESESEDEHDETRERRAA